MKKGFAIIACAFASLAAFAGMDNLRIMFSTPGTDTYADGTSVKAGERYALVWKANADDAFAISADGTTSGGRIVLVYETRADGRCTPVLFQVDDGWMAANGYSGGTWAVYLLDTRLAKGGYAPLGADGLPTVVNASGLAADALLRQSSATDLTGGLSSVEPTAIPQGVTAPVVESIEVKGGEAISLFSGDCDFDVTTGEFTLNPLYLETLPANTYVTLNLTFDDEAATVVSITIAVNA